mgnify:CR=1 FL=1
MALYVNVQQTRFFYHQKPLSYTFAVRDCAFVRSLLNIYNQAGYREWILNPIWLLLFIQVIHCKIMCDV